MAIQRKQYSQDSKNIKIPGEYIVHISEIKTQMTKPKPDKESRPMLVVTFSTSDEAKIRGYYVKALEFHMEALKDLKAACGLKPEQGADDLLGKKCGIAVEAQEPDIDGKVFMRITGYGPASAVERASPKEQAAQQHHDQEPDYFGQIPF